MSQGDSLGLPTLAQQPQGLPMSYQESELARSGPQGGSGSRSVSSLMTPAEARQAVLNRIASGEANSYTELYGGHQFKSLSDHPRIPIPITEGPNQGRYSTAAGRYQFIAPTWDAQAAKLHLTDFSPDSQDAAAWDLANTTYQKTTGRDLTSDTQAGKVNWGALGGQWTSLANGGVGPGMPKASWSGREWTRQEGTDQAASSASTLAPQVTASDPKQQAAMDLLQKITSSRPTGPTVSYDPSKYLPNSGGQLG